MEGLIRIKAEGRNHQPVATCGLDVELECRGKNVELSVLGWIKAYCDKHGLTPYEQIAIERVPGGHFKFSISE
jgi:hypothetical protein